MIRTRAVLCVSFVAVVGYMTLVYWLSDMPSITMDIQDSIAHLLKRDVFEHCLEFVPLGLLNANLFSLLFKTRPSFHVSLAAFVTSTFYGAFDEFHQSLVPHRAWEFGNSMFDVLGDAIGALIGIALFFLLYFIHKKGILKRVRGRIKVEYLLGESPMLSLYSLSSNLEKCYCQSSLL